MGRLLIFNPEHDYALGNGSYNYTPSQRILKLAKELEGLPLLWADKGDFILLSDNSFLDVSTYKKSFFVRGQINEIEPWGWDPAICRRLIELGLDPSLLPSKEDINELRRLSHRRSSIHANQFLESPSVPCEFFDLEEAFAFYERNKGCYFKMPWSSGGRGIVATRELDSLKVREWISGSIRKQGSVIGEIGINRSLDFSSLWHIGEDKINFRGLSIFKSDGRGKYKGNYFGPQEEIINAISRYSNKFNNRLIERQASFIKEYISPSYKGYVGFDMMVDKEGNIYPCVEINLRRTMGHVALEYFKRISINENRNYWDRKCRIASLHSIEEF